ncbi:jg22968, partial [Pararge aegeria aegeria]
MKAVIVKQNGTEWHWCKSIK